MKHAGKRLDNESIKYIYEQMGAIAEAEMDKVESTIRARASRWSGQVETVFSNLECNKKDFSLSLIHI